MFQTEKTGTSREAEILRTIPSVQVALMYKTADGDIEFFLLHRTAGGFTGNWSFPGGKIDPGETEDQAACRETNEESSVLIKSANLTFIRDTSVSTIRKINGQSIQCIYPIKLFAVFINDKSLATNASPGEHDEGCWFSSRDIQNNNIVSLNNGRSSFAPLISSTTLDSINTALSCQSIIKQLDTIQI